MLVKIGLFKKIKGDISLFEEGIQFKYKENKKVVRKLLETHDILKLTTFSFSTFSQIVLFIISIIALKISVYLFIVIAFYMYLKYILAKTIIVNTSNNSFIITFNNFDEAKKFKNIFCEKWKYKCSFFKRKNKKEKE